MSSWTQSDVERFIGRKPAARLSAQGLSPTEKMRALGRMPGGTRNKTEAAYERLLQARLGAGEIRWYAFEPWNLRLGDRCFYSPDFAVMLADGSIEVHEVKGFWQDDALAKFKAAAAQHPFKFIAVRMTRGRFETILEI